MKHMRMAPDDGNIAAGGSGGGSAPMAGGNSSGGEAGAGASGGASSGSMGSGGSGSNGNTQSWRDSLSESIRGEASLSNFKSVEDLAKSYLHANSLIGKDKVFVPNEKSSQEDWDMFYAKAGRPESPDKYGIKIEALGEEGNKSLAETAYKIGLAPKQLKALADWSEQNNKVQMESFQQKQKLQMKEAHDNFIKEIGGQEKFKVVFDKAAQALNFTADEGFKKFLHESGLGADPRVIKYFSSLADRMKEDGIKGRGGAEFGSQIKDVEDKIAGINNNPAFWDGGHQSHKQLVAQMGELLELKARLTSK